MYRKREFKKKQLLGQKRQLGGEIDKN